MRISDSQIINNVIRTKADLRISYYRLLLCIEELILSKPDANTLHHLHHALLKCYPAELLLLSVELDYNFYPLAFVKESTFEKAMNNFFYKAVFKPPKVDPSFIKDIYFACEISAYPEYCSDLPLPKPFNWDYENKYEDDGLPETGIDEELRADYFYERSKKYLFSGNYSKAGHYIDNYIELQADCANGYIHKAKIKWRKENKALAYYFLDLALIKQPFYKDLINMEKAQMLSESNETEAALDLLYKTLVDETTSPCFLDLIWYYIAEICHCRMDNQRAAKAINTALNLGEHHMYYELAGQILRDQLKYRESKIAFIKAYNIERYDQTFTEIKDLEYLAGDVDYVSVASLSIPQSFYDELKYLKSLNP